MIVCFGGAFNPPTKAHLEIYKAVKQTLHFNQFIYMPVSDHYPKPMVSSHHRYAMLNAMTKNYPDIYVDDYELHQSAFKGTYHTLRYLKDKTQDEVCMVCGMDQALTLDTWIESNALKEEFDWIVIRRKGYETLTVNQAFKHVTFIDLDIPISSSQFRKSLDFTLLDPAVAAYIKTHQLYEDENV